jgi:hypothetical protein
VKVKANNSTIVDLWDERIKRIKLASLAYFIAEDEISFYVFTLGLAAV